MANAKNNIVIKKRKAEHASHGSHGAWKVAYADFVTAMMAFFMVMWLMGADDDIKAAIAGYFNNPDISPISIGLSEAKSGSHIDMFQDLMRPGGRPLDLPAGKVNVNMTHDSSLADIKEELEEIFTLQLGMNKSNIQQLEISYEPSGLIIKIIANNFFDSGKSDIKPDFMPAIERIGKVLARYQGQIIRVEGHTDKSESEKSEDIAFGWKLSAERAQKVAQQWLKYVPNLNPKQLQIAGSSYYHPVKENSYSEPANRRVEIIILNSKIE
jgi:chemotaxis protein MotB